MFSKRKKLKRLWRQKWRCEINAQKHRNFLIGRRRGSTSKEFKLLVKNFYLRKRALKSISPSLFTSV